MTRPALRGWACHLPQCGKNPCLHTAEEVAHATCTCGLDAALIGSRDEGTHEPDWKRRCEDEYAIVDRVWKALGVSAYEQAGGKSIDELVADLKAEGPRLRAALETLESRSRQFHWAEQDRTSVFAGMHGSRMGKVYRKWEECPDAPCCDDRKILAALGSPVPAPETREPQ